MNIFYLILFCFGLMTQSMLQAQQVNDTEPVNKPKILYVYDPLCGWCYGFSSVMHQVHETFNSRAEFQVISGGMVRGDRVGPLSDIAPYIRKAYKDVEKLSGVQFGKPYLDVLFGAAEWKMDSEPPSALHVALSTIQPTRQIEIAGWIQKGIYDQGLPPTSNELVQWIATQFDLNPDTLRSELTSENTLRQMHAQFNLASQLQVTGYPAVLAFKDNQWFLLARGFTEYKTLESRIESLLK